jgi:hypothetical protein
LRLKANWSEQNKNHPMQTSRRKTRLSYIVHILLLALMTTLAISCGKRRPPLPPIENVIQATDQLSGFQQGNKIILNWPVPQRNASNESIQSIRRVDIYRLAESTEAPLPLTEDEFSVRSTLIGSVSYSEILSAKDRLVYADQLELTGQPVRLRYAARYINAFGSRAPFSNFLLIEPTQNVSVPPTLISEEESENAIKLSWTTPQQNTDNSKPANILGYNVYRLGGNQKLDGINLKPLNTQPVTANFFEDKTFAFGEQYKYFTRTVSLGSDGNPIESGNSNVMEASPKDVYPPSPPTAISIAAAQGRLSIFFPSNPERDIAGYIIYRSTDPNLPLANWTRLTPEPITKSTYQDSAVESGKKYYYYLVAIDTNGNISKPSEIASETAP